MADLRHSSDEDEELGRPARRQRSDDYALPAMPVGAPSASIEGMNEGMNMAEEMAFSQGDNPAPSGAALSTSHLKQRKSVHDRVHAHAGMYYVLPPLHRCTPATNI